MWETISYCTLENDDGARAFIQIRKQLNAPKRLGAFAVEASTEGSCRGSLADARCIGTLDEASCVAIRLEALLVGRGYTTISWTDKALN